METLIALTSDNALISFEISNPSQTTVIPVTGIEGTLLGIDTRPATGEIYGITTANNIYTLDPMGFSSGSFDGVFTLTEAEETSLLDSGFYVNLHTANFNSGELRGQIDIAAEDDVVANDLVMEESQQVGETMPPDTAATASFNVVYDDATNRFTLTGSYSDLTSPLLPVGDPDAEGNPQSAIHIHAAAAGANGPIVRNLTVDDVNNTFAGSFTLTEAEEAQLLDDGFYVNLHTENFASGELRGQIDIDVEGDVVAYGIPIEESQQVGDTPPPDTAATGAFDIIYETSTNELITAGSFNDLTSPLFPVGSPDAEGNPQSAVHIHMGQAGANGPIVRNLATADSVATLVSTLDIPFEGTGISGFDFNPVADRLRLVGDNDQNFRINVETGAVIEDGDLAFVDGDINEGGDPTVTAVAYTNSFDGTSSTELYNIDTDLDALLLQNPPNDGGLMTIGDLGVDFDELGGFDIAFAGDSNLAYAVSAATLYSIDLATGAATSLGMVGTSGDLQLQGLTAVDGFMTPATDSFFSFEQFLRSAAAVGAEIPFTPTEVGGLNFAQLYDEAFYLRENSDVAAAVSSGQFISGFDHFVQFGWLEGRDASILFEEETYLANNSDVATAVQTGIFDSGFQHFAQFGHIEGRDPSLLFDQADYLTGNNDVAAAVNDGVFGSGFEHYVEFGAQEGRMPQLSLFQEAFYLSQNSDVAAAVQSGVFVDGYEHFLNFGAAEGRDPSALFDESAYLAANSDVAAAVSSGMLPSGFSHFALFGRFEGREPVTA